MTYGRVNDIKFFIISLKHITIKLKVLIKLFSGTGNFSISFIHLVCVICQVISDGVYRSFMNKPTAVLLLSLSLCVRGTSLSLSLSPPHVFLSHTSPTALIKQSCHGDTASQSTGLVGRDIPSKRNFNYDLSLLFFPVSLLLALSLQPLKCIKLNDARGQIAEAASSKKTFFFFCLSQNRQDIYATNRFFLWNIQRLQVHLKKK